MSQLEQSGGSPPPSPSPSPAPSDRSLDTLEADEEVAMVNEGHPVEVSGARFLSSSSRSSGSWEKAPRSSNGPIVQETGQQLGRNIIVPRARKATNGTASDCGVPGPSSSGDHEMSEVNPPTVTLKISMLVAPMFEETDSSAGSHDESSVTNLAPASMETQSTTLQTSSGQMPKSATSDDVSQVEDLPEDPCMTQPPGSKVDEKVQKEEPMESEGSGDQQIEEVSKVKKPTSDYQDKNRE